MPRLARPRPHPRCFPHVAGGGATVASVAVIAALALAGCAAPPQVTQPRGPAGPSATASAGCYRYEIARAPIPTTAAGSHAVLAVQVTATNRTTAPCPGPDGCGISGGWLVLTATDTKVATYNPVGVACVAHPTPVPPVPPGHSVVWATLLWDGHGDFSGPCSPGACQVVRPTEPPGRYRVRWSWLDQVAIETSPLSVTAD